MNNHPQNEAELRLAAQRLSGLHYHLVPIEHGGKRPLLPWKELCSSRSDIDRWFARFGTLNLAVHAGRSGVLVLDADTEGAMRWVDQHCPRTPMQAETPRGGRHYYFAASPRPPPPAVNLFGLGLDVRSGASLIISSPSWSRNHERRWEWDGPVLPPSELPVFPASLIRREPALKPIFRGVIRQGAPAPSGRIHDVTRWITAVESVQGRAGSNQCFKVACRLVDGGLSWEEAWSHLCRWNLSGKAIPPWSEAELRHKLRDAFARG